MTDVTKETFNDEVLKTDLPVVVDFWGPQCVPCLALMPNVEALSQKYAGRVKIAKLEAPKNRRLCLDLKVLSLPTILFYKGGKEVKRLAGNDVSLNSIETWIGTMLDGR
jgi:thioredoxin 1